MGGERDIKPGDGTGCEFSSSTLKFIFIFADRFLCLDFTADIQA
jgi:hypothetical protein